MWPCRGEVRANCRISYLQDATGAGIVRENLALNWPLETGTS